jgi:hypothetical protein
MLGSLEADPQFQRLGIKQEKTHLCVVHFSELHGTILLKSGSAQESSCLCICHLAYKCRPLWLYTDLGGKPFVFSLSVAICFAQYHLSGGQGPPF